ncbi:MAG TPA: hypothetical protein VFB75_10450 [Burkholderiales bacterium]|nr:hypothetical protein [Burkholderiales bacterium]
MKRLIAAAFLGLAVFSSAYAQESRRPSSDSFLGGIVQERDVGLVFDYLRDALNAAMEGRDAPSPDELTRRAEAIGDEVKRRGAAAARAAIDAIEQSVREAMREPRRVTPPTSLQQGI